MKQWTTPLSSAARKDLTPRIIKMYNGGMTLSRVSLELEQQGTILSSTTIAKILEAAGVDRRHNTPTKPHISYELESWPERLDRYEKECGNHMDAIHKILLYVTSAPQTSDTSAYPPIRQRSW